MTQTKINNKSIISKDRILTILKKLALFRGLNNVQFDSILEICNVVPIKKNTTIFEQGDSAKSLFVIISGIVEVSNDKNGVVILLKQGQVLGEFGVISDRPRAAKAASINKDVVLFEITKNDFDFLLGRSPHISYIVMKNMASNLCDRLIDLSNEFHISNNANSAQTKNISVEQRKSTELIPIYPATNKTFVVLYFRISNISNGTLYQSDAKTIINEGQFISCAMAATGFIFTPSVGQYKGSFDIEQSNGQKEIIVDTVRTTIYIHSYD